MFWHAVSPSNSLVVTWENSPVNRDVNSLTNFQAELFADGSFVYRYDTWAPAFYVIGRWTILARYGKDGRTVDADERGWAYEDPEVRRKTLETVRRFKDCEAMRGACRRAAASTPRTRVWLGGGRGGAGWLRDFPPPEENRAGGSMSCGRKFGVRSSLSPMSRNLHPETRNS